MCYSACVGLYGLLYSVCLCSVFCIVVLVNLVFALVKVQNYKRDIRPLRPTVLSVVYKCIYEFATGISFFLQVC